MVQCLRCCCGIVSPVLCLLMRGLSILRLSDANYSSNVIEDLESEIHLQYLEYQWRSISTWNLYSSWCQSQLMMKFQFNKKTPNWAQPSWRKYTYQTAFNQFKRDTLIGKRKNCTAVCHHANFRSIAVPCSLVHIAFPYAINCVYILSIEMRSLFSWEYVIMPPSNSPVSL